jgi:hypothetical protein
MKNTDTAHLLSESYKATRRFTSHNPITTGGFREIVKNPKHYNFLVENLAEGLSDKEKRDFQLISENTRVKLLENASTSYGSPYETLSLPILRRFYPKLIAKELVNVVPIDKPEVLLVFIRAHYGQYDDVAADNYPYQFPYISPDDRISAQGVGSSGSPLVDITRGPSTGINFAGTTGFGAYSVNILSLISEDLNSTNTHVEKDFRIVAVADSDTSSFISLQSPVSADVDGNFSFDAALDSTTSETVVGRINYHTGLLEWQCLGGNINALQFVAVASLEENKINPKMKYRTEKINLRAVERRMSAEWTIPFEQDVKALYDLNAQAEFVNIIGEQIALDIDREIVDALLQANYTNNDPDKHTVTFDKTPAVNYTLGPKMWMENILPPLTNLSANIYNSCLMGSANTLACNPIDAAIFENINDFRYDGNSVDGGDTGYRSATVQGGKWKILTSSVVPAGKIIVKYRSNELQRAAFVYAPYVPALLTPYPLGTNPSLTILSRYATKVIRPEAIGVVEVVQTEGVSA